MQPQLRLSPPVQELLRCPVCRERLQRNDDQLLCANSNCHAVFPMIDGIPVLIDEAASLFSVEDFVSRRGLTHSLRDSGVKKALRQVIPTISKNIKGEHNYGEFAKLLLSQSSNPRVLIIGGGTLGQGIEPLLASSTIELIESDVSFGPRTMLISDAHSIPFEDGSFDGVIAQAVLEHVVDPYKCVGEIHRVLSDQGLVYAETPFMQQVHMGRYDFTRFTHLGHRRLFRTFDEIDSGAVCGPGMALAWSYQHFLLSFTKSEGNLRKLIRAFTNITSFYLKYFDHYLINTAGSLDSASCYYFMGRKSSDNLSDRQLIALYRGVIENGKLV